MGIESGSTHVSDFRSLDTNSRECLDAMVIKAYPVGMVRVDSNGVDEGESRLDLYVGLEFGSADEARDFYNLYAMRVGFKVRTGQLYRSRSDGSVSWRKFVCSKEGFQLHSRTGCPAFIRVQKCDSGKWMIDQINEEHNHELALAMESCPTISEQTSPVPTKTSVEVSQRRKVKLLKEVDHGRRRPSGVINFKRLKRSGDGGKPVVGAEPYAGLEFKSADEAYRFYQAYAESMGFRVRIGQLFRSKNDGSITSRRFVCSKEGFQHPSRLGCGAFMRIKRQDFGTWIVDRLKKEHNHDVGVCMGTTKETCGAQKEFIDEDGGGLDSMDLIDVNDFRLVKRNRVNRIGSDWYSMLFDYFQTRQAEDTGFFYSVEVDSGNCMSVFWADGRSRFSCSQFGDAVIFDTSYRKGNHVVPFATFVGINHHKQPVLLGCALIADESKESFTWLFQTWVRAMSWRQPKSIVADQDTSIQQAISEVFPGTHHRFSKWQIRDKEQEILRTMPNEFRYEYEKCINQSQTNIDFNTSWSVLISKYGLQDNGWLKAMYAKRECWVPLYLRGKFFAGIPINGTVESFFGKLLNGQTPLKEFISRYEQGLERRREEEREQDFNTCDRQAILQTKEPVEDQCRRFYTLTIFKILQNELLQSYNYIGIKTYEEGSNSKYLVYKCGNEIEKYLVSFGAATPSVSCSCQMFEYEGLVCRHVLNVFNLLNIKELPSRYVLHRWTRNAKYGTIRDAEPGISSQELKALMVWSLRETACKYVEYGAKSIGNYKLANNIMREGEKKLWEREVFGTISLG